MTDNSIISALFQIMKFNILSASRAENQRSPFSDDYFFAWSSGVYPYGSEIDFHKPFGSEFQVSQSQMEDLAELLDKRWMKNNPMTFYELEDHFGGKHEMTNGWDRSKLIRACRYFHLKGLFRGHEFWETMLKKMEHPMEASQVIRPLQEREYSLE